MFGYDRTEVEQKMGELQAKLHEVTTAYEEAQKQVSQLQAHIEDYEIRLAAARRDRVQALSQNGTNVPNAIILMGPVSTFASLASLAGKLDHLDELSIQFRTFRDGFYRVDVWVENMVALSTWFKEQPNVREVHIEENTLHVVLKEVQPL